MKKYTITGFSLIELMIVVAIVGILAGIAVPGYVSYTQKSQRTIAISSLLQAQSAFENYYSQNNQYPTGAAATAFLTPHNTTYYQYTPINATTTAYTLTATALGNQANDKDGNTVCSPLTVTNTNIMSPLNCWHH